MGSRSAYDLEFTTCCWLNNISLLKKQKEVFPNITKVKIFTKFLSDKKTKENESFGFFLFSPSETNIYRKNWNAGCTSAGESKQQSSP